jgi:hypothetical protein
MPEQPTEHAELDGLLVTITRSAGPDGALVVFIDGPGEDDTNADGTPAIRVRLNDDPIYTGRPYEPVDDAES